MIHVIKNIFPSDISINELTLMQKIIGHCDVKHKYNVIVKAIMSDSKVSISIITITSAISIGLAAILVIMTVSTFITIVILYILWRYILFAGETRVSVEYHKPAANY